MLPPEIRRERESILIDSEQADDYAHPLRTRGKHINHRSKIVRR